MKIGIIGRSGSGRSTVFDALTGKTGGARNADKTRMGTAKVPDQRLDLLTALYKPRATICAEVELALPPNPTAGPLDAAVVSQMRDVWALVLVAGVFAADDAAAAAAELVTELNNELVLADMDKVEKRTARIKKGGGDRPGEVEALQRAAAQLDQELPLRLLSFDDNARKWLDDVGLISQRPLLTVINVAEDQAGGGPSPQLGQQAEAMGSELLWLCAALEAEIAGMEPEDRPEFLEAYGLTQPAAHRFVQATLALLNQICFFTVGQDEVRAWAIPRDSNAKRAARAIHTDLEKGFIRAEVVPYQDLLELGGEPQCKAAGKLRTEGKDYLVQEGDVINVRFNV